MLDWSGMKGGEGGQEKVGKSQSLPESLNGENVGSALYISYIMHKYAADEVGLKKRETRN